MHQDVSLLTLNDVCKRVGLSRATVYRVMKDPARRFPKPCQPWPGAKRWRSDEIRAWIDGVSAERAA